MNRRTAIVGLLLFFLFNTAVLIFLKPIYLDPDGIGYFSYLPSIFVQHTLSFLDTYRAYPTEIPMALTSRGWILNFWAVGSSVLWLPYYEAARLYVALHGFAGATPWGSVYLGIVNFANMAMSLAVSILLWQLLPRGRSLRFRLGIIAAAFFGTPLFYYSFLTGAMSHAGSAFATGLFFWYWLETAEDPERPVFQWFLLGMLAGVAALVRTQEALVLVAPIYEGIHRPRCSTLKQPIQQAGALALGFLIGFSPQSLIWTFLNGNPVYSSEAFNVSVGQFHLLRCLFSPFHGILLWTPLYGLALGGLLGAIRRGEWKSVPLVLILFAQGILSSFSRAWWFDFSFGVRQLTGTFVIVGLGLAALFQDAGKTRRWLFGVLIAGCTSWTFLLALMAYGHQLDLSLPLSVQALHAALAQGGDLLYMLAHPFARYGRPPADFALVLLALEVLGAAWLTVLFSKNRSRVLAITFLPWIAYALVCILWASRAPRPVVSGSGVLTEAQAEQSFMDQADQHEAALKARGL